MKKERNNSRFIWWVIYCIFAVYYMGKLISNYVKETASNSDAIPVDFKDVTKEEG